MVKIHIYQPLPEMLALGKHSGKMIIEETVESGTNVAGLFRRLSARFPAFCSFCEHKSGDKLRSIIVIVGDSLVHESEFNATTLHDGDEVLLVPPYQGG